MKYTLLLFLFISFIGKVQAFSYYDYGLYLRSYDTYGSERTSLYLDDGRPFDVEHDFTVSFQMLVRSNEYEFGHILHLITDTGYPIYFSFVAGGKEELSPALIFNKKIATLDFPIERGEWQDVVLKVFICENKIEINYSERKKNIEVPLKNIRKISVGFGQVQENPGDVAPVNIRNIKIVQDGNLTREWRLEKHCGDTCYDEQRGAIARAKHAVWLIDKHIEWEPIYQNEIIGKLYITFDAREAHFYLVSSKEMEMLDETGALQRKIPIKKGYLAMQDPDYLLYDTISNEIISYSFNQCITSFFSFETNAWSYNKSNWDVPRYYNHARCFNPLDSSYYFWGGYGLYQYRNALFRLKPQTGELEKVEYEPQLEPRFASAMAAVDDELYIFGGCGNDSGKQEFNSRFYSELHSINLKTRHSRLLWKDTVCNSNVLMASTMYFNSVDSSFYGVSLDNGGVLWKIPIKKPGYKVVSKPIHNHINYQDFHFSFYDSPSHKKMFLVMDFIMSDRQTHKIFIYSINTPLLNEADIKQEIVIDKKVYSLYFIVIFLLLVSSGGVIFYRSRKTKVQFVESVSKQVKGTQGGRKEEMAAFNDILFDGINYCDRSHSSISLLGTFNVRDKAGNDITSNFTSRLRCLLILLILYTEKEEQGISATKIVDLLWHDKEERAARNNRNVALSQLRILLEKVGDIEFVSDANFLCIKWGEGVFCDYHEAFICFNEFRKRSMQDQNLLKRIWELLLYGPLLTNMNQTWLSDFKEIYSCHCVDFLKELLDVESQHNHYEMIVRIADIMFLHDPLNESALMAKCSVFLAQGRMETARSIYERFCKEYRDLMGRDYPISFSDICRKK